MCNASFCITYGITMETSSIIDPDHNSTVSSGYNEKVYTALPFISRLAIAFIMTALNLIGVILNCLIFCVVVRMVRYRKQTSYWFVLNLCIIDGLASVIVLPMAIICFVENAWIFDTTWCKTEGFFGTLFTFASICNVCMTSIERYYSIKHPMHHSAHMTLPVTLVILMSNWVMATILAALPLIGWHEYGYQDTRSVCGYDWTVQGQQSGYVILTVILCFILPAITMCSMYLGVYKVAKQTAKQVIPGQQGECSTTNSKRETNNPQRKYQGHLKAIKTLLIITGLFFLLWGPCFCLQLYGVSRGYIPASHTWETLAVWLGFTSFAVNPCVYGILNRSIREELSTISQSILQFCRRGRQEPCEPLGNEDFLQFLDRTSILPKTGNPLAHELTLPAVQESVHM